MHLLVCHGSYQITLYLAFSYLIMYFPLEQFRWFLIILLLVTCSLRYAFVFRCLYWHMLCFTMYLINLADTDRRDGWYLRYKDTFLSPYWFSLQLLHISLIIWSGFRFPLIDWFCVVLHIARSYLVLCEKYWMCLNFWHLWHLTRFLMNILVLYFPSIPRLVYSGSLDPSNWILSVRLSFCLGPIPLTVRHPWL